eukprot:COSAG02_NODE_210_length_28878_cov_133.787136_25_plen_144_part_00
MGGWGLGDGVAVRWGPRQKNTIQLYLARPFTALLGGRCGDDARHRRGARARRTRGDGGVRARVRVPGNQARTAVYVASASVASASFSPAACQHQYNSLLWGGFSTVAGPLEELLLRLHSRTPVLNLTISTPWLAYAAVGQWVY